MSEFDLVSEYIETANAVTALPELERETEAVIRELGFDYFAVLHHLESDNPHALPGVGHRGFTNYPTAWLETIRNEHLVSVDPVLAAAQRATRGFLWTDVPRMIDLSDHQRDIFIRAEKAGLGTGYTVPLHVPGECSGNATFAVRTGGQVRHESLPMLHYLGGFAFEAGRKLARQEGRERYGDPKLTDRQIDCIVLAGRGLSARAAAMQLGIKQDTFQKHMLDAKQRMGVRTTTELVVRSLFEGRIAFKDLLPNEKKRRSS